MKNNLFNRFCSYYKKYKLLFTLDILASFIMAALSMLYPILTREIYKTGGLIEQGDVNKTIILGVILIIIYLMRFGLKFFIDYYGHTMGVKMQADMRLELFKKLEDLPFSFYDENETGKIMSRMTNDLQNVSELAHHGPENILISGTTLLCSFAYLLTLNWILALMIFVAAPILFLISMATRKIQIDAFTKTKEDLALINGQLESSISGIRVTKSFNNREKEIEKFNVENKKYIKSRKFAYKALGLFHSSTTFVISLFNVICFVGGGILAIKTDVFDVADYLAFVVSINLFTTPMQTLVTFVEQFQDGATGFKRFVEIIDTPSEIDDGTYEKETKLKGKIDFNNVTFDYETKNGILNGINLNINPGEKIALVGESGGGKTTICHLIPRFYRVTCGNITIDNQNINDYKLSYLRENIGIVQQDVFLFSGSIKDNVLYGKLDATDEEVIDALKKANIYDYVQTLPDGINTLVGERGVKLSGGQKQRIAIARIFLKNPSILILDEATSALDNATEMAIQKSLDLLSIDKTCIIVAHRLSTVKNCNRIIVVEDGMIKEVGTHNELLEKNGIYAGLYNQQFNNVTFK